MIKDLTYNKQKFRFEFLAPKGFRSINGNSLRSSRGIISTQLISLFTAEEISSLESSKCHGNKSTLESFVERLMMTDLQLFQLIYQYNDDKEFKLPIDILDTYMDVQLSIHIKIIQFLDKYSYVKVHDFDGTNITLTPFKTSFFNSNVDYELFMVPANPKINSYVKMMRYEQVETNPLVESKSLF